MYEIPAHQLPENPTTNAFGQEIVQLPKDRAGLDSLEVGMARHLVGAMFPSEYTQVITVEMEMRNTVARIGEELSLARTKELQETFFINADYTMPVKSDYRRAA